VNPSQTSVASPLLGMLGRDVSTLQFLEMLIIQSGGEHLASMKAAAR
jgi:hypothetical protein